MAKINIYIDEETGEPIIEGEGFDGKGCEEAMKRLEELLGEVTERNRKPEYEQSSRRQSRSKGRTI